jgi:uncharacterized Tic20 family protein
MTSPAAPAAAPLSEAEDRQWASIAHLGGILGPLPSLIIWLVFKDRGAFTNSEAKEALNFQITATIAWIALGVLNGILTVVTLGIWFAISWILYLALWAAMIAFSIIGFTKAKDGIPYRYPVALRLIK